MSDIFDAIQSGDAKRVAKILDTDPSQFGARANGVSPLMMALYVSKLDIARLIAERTPRMSFHEACAMGDIDRVRTMLSGDSSLLETRSADGFPPLGLAIFFRQPATAKFLIERGADVNAAASNAQKVAPLHAAAAVLDHATMKVLLERGADVNAKQQADYTPLHGAASRGDIEMAKLLLEHGADRDSKAADGMTPADVARKYGQMEFANWLSRAEG